MQCADTPLHLPDGDVLSKRTSSDMEGVPVSSSGGSQTVAISSGLTEWVDESLTGRLLIIDSSIPEAPFLGRIPKPA